MPAPCRCCDQFSAREGCGLSTVKDTPGPGTPAVAERAGRVPEGHTSCHTLVVTDDPATVQRQGRLKQIIPIVGAIAALAALLVVRLANRPADTSATGPSTSAPAGVVIDDAPTQVSKDDVGGISFRDVTAPAGLAAAQSDGPVTGFNGMTSGAAVADFNGDGRPDIYLTRVRRPNALYLNDANGQFHDVAAEAGVEGGDPSRGSTVPAVADVNADGHPDLFVAGIAAAPDALYVNDGTGHFHDEATARGLVVAPPGAPDAFSTVHGATFHDIDNDGAMDLLVTDWDANVMNTLQAEKDKSGPASVCDVANKVKAAGSPASPTATATNRSRLYHNDGAGHFVDITASSGLDLNRTLAFTPQFVDVDGDGRDDLLVTGDFCTSRLYHNVDGTHFTDITQQAHVGVDENGMGSIVRDVNGDGKPDWFVTSISYPTKDGSCPVTTGTAGCSGNRLYVNDGAGSFRDATDEFGLRNGWWGWGGAVEDFGNDGRLSFMMTNGFEVYDPTAAGGAASPCDAGQPSCAYFQRFLKDPMRFWIKVGDKYVDAASQVGLTDTGVGHALIPFDYDGDGRVDVLITHSYAPPTLYRNETPGDRHWLDVVLDDPSHPGNRQGVGARVQVTRSPGDAPVTGWITTSGSYESQRPADLHVGLGAQATVARVDIWWPGAQQPQTVTGVPADQTLHVTRA